MPNLFTKDLKTTLGLFVLISLMVLTGCKEAPRQIQEPEVRQGDDQTTRTFGDYTVHFKAFNSTFLQPEVAARYGFERNPKQGLINIAVLQNTDEGTKAVTAALEGQSASLAQQIEKLQFREVKEGSAVYYLAPFSFFHEEVLKFTVNARPANQPDETFTVKFQQKFYQD